MIIDTDQISKIIHIVTISCIYILLLLLLSLLLLSLSCLYTISNYIIHTT